MGRKRATQGRRNWPLSIGWSILCCALLLASCSTQKNTSGTRFYHSVTARFNTLHNGEMSFLEGKEAQEKGHKDDYTRLLPMYISTNKQTMNLGKGNYETAIEKCEKAIKVHTIKKRPTSNSNKRKSAKEKEFLARKEFNPYLYHAWFLMAESQFRKGEFIEAASTYNYILRLYSTQPDITCVARARLARCYVALEWPYDAEDILNKMKRDSVTLKGQKEIANTRAAFLIETEQYKEAIPHLEKAIKAARGKLNKARLNFLLGQLYRETGNDRMAYKSWGRVIKANPPYELAFNARILQTEVMSGSKYKQMISRLKRMAKSDKNKNYLDQVYYAIGNIYLSVQDTAHCIGAYEKGVKDGTQNGISKAVLLLHLSQLYWEMENYIEAARTYKACVAILDKEHEEYKESERRSKILTELEPHLSAVKLQDSLQELAKMPEPEYMAAINRVIEALKKQEKEQEKLQSRNGTAATNGNRGNNPQANRPQQNQSNSPAANNAGQNGQKGAWYFYNPTATNAGKQDFQKKWGQRKNEDNWRISHKASLPTSGDADQTEQPEVAEGEDSDLLYGAVTDEEAEEAERARKDSLANDPHHPEYYLKQIPFTEEQMEESDQALCTGLYNAGIIEQEQLENFPLAEETMLRFIGKYPEHENMDNIYYHMFLLYGRMNKNEEAESYRQKLTEEFPESKYATLIGNPNYELIARDGRHIEDSVYAASYAAYQNSDYETVGKNYEWSTQNFPEGKHRARLMFVHAMSLLYSGQRDSFMVVLQEVIQKYPKEEVTDMANAIVKGLKEGKILMNDRYDTSNIWNRRTRMDNDSTQEAPVLNEERYSNFAFVLAYPTGEIDEDQLLFEMARYNFTNYMVRNFDIEISDNNGISMMVIKGFLSYDEVHSYAQSLYADSHMNGLLEGMRTLLISEDNLKMIGTDYSFDEYKDFYDEKFAPLEIPEGLIIDEPTDLEIKDPDEVEDEKKKEEEESDSGTTDYDDFFDGF